MYVAEIRLSGFRSYRSARFSLGAGINIIVGGNATGKTNLVEAAYWALRGASPRVSRDEKLLQWKAEAARVEIVLDDGRTIAMAYAPRLGRRAAVDGVTVSSIERLRRAGPVFLFVPESLLLVKGGPARRRAHLDAFSADVDPAYQTALADLQLAVRQRNAQLARVRSGGPERALDPWDAQLVETGLALESRRRSIVAVLAERFPRYAAELSPAGGSYYLSLRSPLDEIGDDPDRYREALRARRPREIESAVSALGPHRDDLQLYETGTAEGRRDLRPFGSQGEQRAAVLALLLAERDAAESMTGVRGPLFLDDVMSELDDARRRLLMSLLVGGGQAVVTTTTTMYFTSRELEQARVIMVQGSGEQPAEGGPE